MNNKLRRSLACAIALILTVFAGAYAPARADTGVANRVVFRCLGDFVIHDAVLEAAKQADGSYDFRPMLAPVADLIGDADITVANVDGVMGANTSYVGYPRFSTPVALMDALKDAGVDMLTMANNHALDYDYTGLIAQMDTCEERGMDFIGGARTQQEADTPQIREINGIRIGFLNFTTQANGRQVAKANRNMPPYVLNMAYRKNNFESDAKALRDAGAEVIVAFMHWGEEYNRSPDEEEKIMVSRLIRAGADVIVGGHPHVIQRNYWREGTRTHDGGKQRTLLCYSLGNFLSNQQQQYRNCGIIFEFTLEKDASGKVTVHSPGYIPVFVWREQVKKGYTYQVVATERAMNNVPSGMSKSVRTAMKRSWKDTIEYLSTSSSAAECIHVQ